MVLAKLLLYSQSEAEEAKPGTKQRIKTMLRKAGEMDREIYGWMGGWVDDNCLDG